MSGFDFGSGGLPVAADIQAIDGNLVLVRSDGSTRVLCPVPRGGETGPAGRGVSHTDIVDGNLVVSYTDGTVLTAGHVLGEPGTDGLPGRGIVAVEIVAGRLRVTFSDNAVSDLGNVQGPAGAAGRGITSSVIAGGHLVITYTDGTSADLGAVTGASGAAGRGVTGSSISNGHLILSFSDGTTQDVGQVVGAAASLGALRRVYISSAEITASNGSYGFAAAVPAGATEVEVECVGGGSSGFSGRYDTTNGVFFAGHGGYPGGVSRRRLRVADVPNSLAVTIGAGGVGMAPQAAASRTNGGGVTSFGALVQAAGGPAVSHVTMADLPDPGAVSAPSDVPLGQPGSAGTLANAYGASAPPAGFGNSAVPSHGPGAGGAGPIDSSNARGGDGGASGVGRPDTALRGGQINGTSGQRHGAAAASPFGYGAGGSGGMASFNGPPLTYVGGIGGAPGGGGGGGPGVLPDQNGYNMSGSRSGDGGRGAVRLHFSRYEVP
jgi:hypothetical protein